VQAMLPEGFPFHQFKRKPDAVDYMRGKWDAVMSLPITLYYA